MSRRVLDLENLTVLVLEAGRNRARDSLRGWELSEFS